MINEGVLVLWRDTTSSESGQDSRRPYADSLLFFEFGGGLEPEVVSNSLKCYNTTTNEWTNKAAMLCPRADHSMVTYKDKLYVCGGWMEDEAVGNRLLVSTIDEYCINTDQWKVKSTIPTPRYHAGITVVNHQLFVIGGFHADATFDRTTGKSHFVSTIPWANPLDLVCLILIPMLCSNSITKYRCHWMFGSGDLWMVNCGKVPPGYLGTCMYHSVYTKISRRYGCDGRCRLRVH